MTKNTKIAISAVAVIIAIIVIFLVFSSSGCNRQMPNTNRYSLTHLILTAPEGDDTDWQEMKKVFRKRIDIYGDMRVFQIDEKNNTAIVEITGAKDPDQLSSLLIAPLRLFIKPANSDAQIATYNEITEVYSIVFEDESLGLYIGLNDDATTRLKAQTKDASPDNPIKINMSIDGRHFSDITIKAALPEGTLVFPAPENMEADETDMLSFMLANPLPFDIGVYERSYFVPPKSSGKAPIKFYDVLLEDFLSD